MSISKKETKTSKQKSSSKLSNLIFGLILAAYALYAAIFIFKSSFVVGGERYFVLFDDAMISMRYAKNLADGFGLVWNPGGARVEGFTNPLWTVWMAALHLLPVAASKTSLMVQISGAACILASLFFVRKIAFELSKNDLAAILAVILTAFYMPLNNWALLGMEVSLLVLLLCASTYLILRNLRQSRFTIWPYLLLGVGTLVRLDMAVPYLVSLIFLAIADARNRKKHILWGLSLLAITLGGQTLFRLVYYHDPLPNTYYLKVAGYPIILRMARGAYALYTLVWNSNWLLVLLPFTILFFRRDRAVMLLFALFIAQVAYSVYVGGDAWEHRGGSNRYIAVAIPLFFILFTYAAALLFETLIGKLHLGRGRNGVLFQGLLLTAFVTLAMVNFNFLLGNPRSLERWLLLRDPMFTTGNSYYVRMAQNVDEITRPEATIAVVAAGTTPYFSQRPAIDLLGKSDRHIAGVAAANVSSWRNLELFRPGHMKWDYDYSIGELRPDVVVQLWGDTDPAMKYLLQDYVTGGAISDKQNEMVFYLRKDSPNILWDKVRLCSGECLNEAPDSE